MFVLNYFICSKLSYIGLYRKEDHSLDINALSKLYVSPGILKEIPSNEAIFCLGQLKNASISCIMNEK